MAVTYVDGNTVAFQGAVATHGLNVVIPATTLVGDVILFHYTAATALTTSPIGFTLVQAGTSVSGITSAAVYYKTAVLADIGSTISFVSGSSAKVTGMVEVYTGVSTSPIPIVTSGQVDQANVTSTTHAMPSIASATAGTLVNFLSIRDAATPSTTYAPPANTPHVRDILPSGGTNTFVSISADSVGPPDLAAGTYTGNWTIDQTTPHSVTIAVFLNPGTPPPVFAQVAVMSGGAWVVSNYKVRESGSWV